MVDDGECPVAPTIYMVYPEISRPNRPRSNTCTAFHVEVTDTARRARREIRYLDGDGLKLDEEDGLSTKAVICPTSSREDAFSHEVLEANKLGDRKEKP